MKTKNLLSMLIFFFQSSLFADSNFIMVENQNSGFNVDSYNIYDPDLKWVRFYTKGDPNFFLGNFYPAPVDVFGIKYPTSEHAYQAQKFIPGSKTANAFLDPKNVSALSAYKLGKSKVDLKFEAIKDWNMVQDKIMYEVVFAKFNQNENLKVQLLATGMRMLVEWTKFQSTGHDTFWGINRVTKQGKNHLGKILMLVRAQLRNEIDFAEITEILEGLKNDNL